MKKNIWMVLALVAICLPSIAKAAGDEGWQFDPKLMYLIEDTKNSGAETDVNTFLLDLPVGYKFSSPIFLGGMIGYENKTTSSDTTTHDVYESVGPTFGLMTDNVYLLFTYYITSQYQNQAPGGTTTYSNGTGYQLDFAYLISAGSGWSVGPCLSFRSLHYGTVTNPAGNSSSTDYTYTTLLPYVALQFIF